MSSSLNNRLALGEKLLSVVITGRNDDYGGDFNERLSRSVTHNSRLLEQAGIAYEYVLVEWNPIPGKPRLSGWFLEAFDKARAVIVESDVHQAYGLNAAMPFYEMPAKNAGIVRAAGDYILVTNADILFDDALIECIANQALRDDTFYRAHRIDVPPGIEWPALKEPCHHLASGEGRFYPPYYLGGAGDFALAATSLWRRLGGYDEVARFTTRAKDWRFFLAVAARGLGIEFIGDIYHLDHDEGFRNTAATVRNSQAAHFGGQWDFEYALLQDNGDDWGLRKCLETTAADGRLTTLSLGQELYSQPEINRSLRWMEWLTAPPGGIDMASAYLMHGILTCQERHARLIVRPLQPRTAVACVGLARVASEFDIEVCANWQWPSGAMDWVDDFVPEPDVLQPGDLVLEEGTESCRVLEYDQTTPAPLFSSRMPPLDPPFNPFLTRRLLRALLKARVQGYRTLGIFGAGGHTRELLSWGLPPDMNVKAIFSTWKGGATEVRGVAVHPFEGESLAVDIEALLLSSISYEAEMVEVIHDQHSRLPIITLYSDWPRNFWSDRH